MEKTPISIHSLRTLITDIKGSRMGTIISETEVKMNKTGNPYHGLITKRATTNVNFGFDYENSVNAQRVREGLDADFEAMPRKWGMRMHHSTLVAHKGEFYVECKVNSKPKDVTYFNTQSRQPVDYNLFKDYMPGRSEGRQEVEKTVELRDFKLTSIKEIKINGLHYIVVA